MEKFIPQMEPFIGKEERDAMQRYLEGDVWLTEFKKTQEFENQICDFTGAKHCIATNNGTISLTLALLACDTKQGDEVIVPDFTMIASPNSAKLIGANPVIVDIEKETLCMDIEEARKAITKKTKALMHVSFNGRTNDLEQFRKLCADHKIAFIEDAAQSLGSFYRGKHIGTFGDVGSISFSAPKIITTGQGGALMTNDEALYKKISRLKDFGRAAGGNDIHDTIGYNFKFTDMQAVIGIEQMKKLPERAKRKKEMYKLYHDGLKSVDQIEFVKTDLKSTAPWFIDIYVEDPMKLGTYLKGKNIGTRAVYPPINEQKAYNIRGNFPVTESYAHRGLWLPSSLKLTNEDIERVCSSIKEFYGE